MLGQDGHMWGQEGVRKVTRGNRTYRSNSGVELHERRARSREGRQNLPVEVKEELET